MYKEIDQTPYKQEINAKNLIQCSVIKGHLVSDYLLVGHSDVTNVLSPGRALYNVIKTWPHFRH